MSLLRTCVSIDGVKDNYITMCDPTYVIEQKGLNNDTMDFFFNSSLKLRYFKIVHIECDKII